MAIGTQSDSLQKPGPGQAVKEQAGAMWSDAKETARAKAGEQQQSAASGIGELAGALRSAARQIDGTRSPTTARVAQQAADGLERMSQTLRSKDLDTVLRDVEGFARSQPALFLGAAVAAGFLAVRFLKSSSSEGEAAPSGQGETMPLGQGSDGPGAGGFNL